MILNDNRQEDITYVIEHYGKKGMHWGQRKQSIKSNMNKSVRENQRRRDDRIQRLGGKKGGGYTGVVKAKAKSMSPERKKQLKRAAIGVGIVGGAAVAAALISRHNKLKIKDINMSKQTTQQVKNLIKDNGNVKTTTSAAHKAFMKEFTTKQRKINSASNQSLKSLYSLAETPIKDRGYLPEWT